MTLCNKGRMQTWAPGGTMSHLYGILHALERRDPDGSVSIPESLEKASGMTMAYPAPISAKPTSAAGARGTAIVTMTPVPATAPARRAARRGQRAGSPQRLSPRSSINRSQKIRLSRMNSCTIACGLTQCSFGTAYPYGANRHRYYRR